MKWTIEKPKIPGWYFTRDKYNYVSVVYVHSMCDGHLIVGNTVRCEPLNAFFDKLDGQFAGPFPEPTE